MAKAGLLIDMKSKPGQDEAVEQLFRSVLPMAREDPTTTTWIAVRFARDHHGIFHVFPDPRSREMHLSGSLVKILRARKGDIFSRAPEFHKIEVLDDVVAPDLPEEPDSKGFLMTFRPRPGREADLERFLRERQPFVLDDPKTSAWFAVRLEDGSYGIFDVFPDSEEIKRLTGTLPANLASQVGSLIKGKPKLDMLSVSAEKLPST